MKWFLVVFFSVAFSYAGPQDSHGGSIVGNGGDGISIEFRNLARGIYQNLQISGGQLAFDGQRFQRLVEEADIQTEDRLFLRGKEVDAINYPTLEKIVISRQRWATTSRSVATMVSLIFHEILGLMDIHDDTLVKSYVDSYVNKFIDISGDTRPRLISKCLVSLGESELHGSQLPLTNLSGMRNFLLFRQNSEYLVYLEDNLIPRSMRPYDKASRFMGYFKCHINPGRTQIVCTDPPCSGVSFNWNESQSVFEARVKVNRTLGTCKTEVPENGAMVHTYAQETLYFPPGRCELFLDSK